MKKSPKLLALGLIPAAALGQCAPACAPTPAPAPETTTTTTPPAAPAAPVVYENCDAVRAAGAAPIHRGDPGYGSHLDRDSDGVGCEG